MNQSIARQYVTALEAEMIARTQSGEDIKGSSFKPYSKDYAAIKGVGRGDVDMTLSGNMLEGTKGKVKRGAEEAEIAITGRLNKLKAYNHNVGDTQPRREFFGFTASDLRKIARDIKSDNAKFFKKKPKKEVDGVKVGDLRDAIEGLTLG